MNNTTNTNHNTLFTAKNEERFLKTFERLVDHIVATDDEKDAREKVSEWLASTKKPSHTAKNIDQLRIEQLEKELAQANAQPAGT